MNTLMSERLASSINVNVLQKIFNEKFEKRTQRAQFQLTSKM